ncbi:MAG TPA: DUF4169 family protein [Candidatus Sulfotelmatobacter sp.]|nr:DUF4169 family protein [Candidatus Sulfotelmatobacter sp.]
MAEVVNLNRFRKAKQRQDDARKAEENRVRFGRTKVEKAKDRSAADKLAEGLDGKKIDD